MIIWITAKAAAMPCDQRALVVEVFPEAQEVRVTLCGDGLAKWVHFRDICGVELSDRASIKFRVAGWETWNVYTRDPAGRF